MTDVPGVAPASLPLSSSPPQKSARGKIVLALIFAAALAAFFYFDLKQYLSFEALKANRDRLLALTGAHHGAAVALFITIYIAQTALCLPGAAVLTVVGGFLFGSVLGTLYVNLGATTGATLAFLAARYLLRDWVEAKFGSKLGPLQEGFSKNAFSYLMTLRLIPIFPFFLVNLLSGLTRVTLGTYVLTTAIGIIPGTFVYTYAGSQLGNINSLKEIASPNVLAAFSLLGLLFLLPILYKKLTKKQHSS